MDDGHIREVSRSIFGNRYKLEVIAEVDRIQQDEPVVFARQIAQRLDGPADNQVRQVVLQLAEGGLLAEIVDKSESKAVRYHVLESCLWAVGRQLLDELRAAPNAVDFD